ncbi:hypothetical protein GMST_43730 [Geomonas silvestris]|uniref:Uncharacterized protein n=1 Tax=Geomonas silvestris TaxID=2740184 RepID=A0A6V8MPS1_9BACT|nr:hypothetical protein GMST_43730 [Geomonas silvestris]
MYPTFAETVTGTRALVVKLVYTTLPAVVWVALLRTFSVPPEVLSFVCNCHVVAAQEYRTPTDSKQMRIDSTLFNINAPLVLVKDSQR